MSNEKQISDLTVELSKEEAVNKLKWMLQNIDRAIRLIELDAPFVILANETRMLQRRALWVEAYYEEYMEMKDEKIVEKEKDNQTN